MEPHRHSKEVLEPAQIGVNWRPHHGACKLKIRVVNNQRPSIRYRERLPQTEYTDISKSPQPPPSGSPIQAMSAILYQIETFFFAKPRDLINLLWEAEIMNDEHGPGSFIDNILK